MGAARGARVEGALLAVKQLREQGKEQPRASTTDSDERVMKMPDGGYRPGYNIQMATAGSPPVVHAPSSACRSPTSAATWARPRRCSTRSSAAPARCRRCSWRSANHARHGCVERCESRGVEALIPIPARSRNAGPNADRTHAIVAWRVRMKTDHAKQLLTSEVVSVRRQCAPEALPRAQALVRLHKVTCVAMLAAIGANSLQHATALLA